MLAERLARPLNFMQVVLGPRQVGKTTGVEQVLADWKDEYWMVTADKASAPPLSWLELNWKIARAKGKGTLLVVDEIQKIEGWSNLVKALYDEDRKTRALQVVLLGSASLSLKAGLEESLAGRFEIIPAPHWRYRECRDAFGWDLRHYLKYGGYPAGAELTGDTRRWQDFINHSIIEPVLSKDLLAVVPVHKPALFRQTFMLSLKYPAMEVSLQKMLGQLQESGNVTTIKHYLQLLEGAFLLKTLQKFSGSAVRQRGSSPKIIPLNTGLVNAQVDPDDIDRNPEWFGRLFECAIGAKLCQDYQDVMYWRDGRHEVDYVVAHRGRTYAIEVKSTRVRRCTGLAAFMARYPDTIPVILDAELGEQFLLDEWSLPQS